MGSGSSSADTVRVAREYDAKMAKQTDVRPRIAVLMGGKSSEREVSLITGDRIAGVLEALEFPVERIDVGSSLWEDISAARPDVAFIALHGKWGEDGTVQSVLELMGIPYTGSGVLASALAMDKSVSKLVFKAAGLPVAKHVSVSSESWHSEPEPVIRRVSSEVGFPCVAKPVREGSAMGVTLTKGVSDLAVSLACAFEYDDQAMVEEFLPGTEFTVGVLGFDGLRALPSVEVIPSDEFYTYESKYTPGASAHVIPARLPQGMEDEVAGHAVAAHKVIGCRDFSRIDFKLDRNEKPIILEINTIPGMTPTSLFPEAAKAAGISFEQLIETLVGYALLRSSSPLSSG